jgi:dienelactone hydrolase
MTTPTHTRVDLTFASGDSYCAAWLYLPAGVEAPPVVVLGHGLGATREMRLDAFAERFADAGIAVLAFTYRHFGDSGGEPRQLLSIKRQLADWDAAIAHLKPRTDVDSSRLAVWGSSFGGGHSITVASRHPELRAAVAQCPFTDGLASARALGPKASMRLMPLVARDLLSSVRGRPPVTIPLAAPAGSPALMNAPDALPGYEALIPTGATFVNEAAARVVVTIPMYRPGRQAKSIRFPILFCVSNTDSVTPPAETIRYARTAPRGEIKTYDAGHFDFYLGDAFEALVRDQVEFLTRHLALTPPSSKTDRAVAHEGTTGEPRLPDRPPR